MSVCYWMIEGVGLCVGDIEPHVNKEKVARFFLEKFPDDIELKTMVDTGDYSNFDMEDFFYGNGFENLADVLCHCDDTNTITFCDDGDGNCYFYYPPSMPWEQRSEEPKSIDEVHDRIVKAVCKISDMSKEEVLEIINDDLYVLGCG